MTHLTDHHEASMRISRTVTAVLAGLAVAGCKSGGTPGTGRTERERDSVIGQSQLPGATGVRKALEVTDSAQRRRAGEDSAGAGP